MNEEVINMFPETISCRKKVAFSSKDMKKALSYVKAGKSIREAAYMSNVPYATVRRNWLKLKEKAAVHQNMVYMKMPKLMNITRSNHVMGSSIPTRRPSESDELDSFGNDSNGVMDIFKIEEVDYMQNRQRNNGSTTGSKITRIFSGRRKRKSKININKLMRNNTVDISENRDFSVAPYDDDYDQLESNQQDEIFSDSELYNHNNQHHGHIAQGYMVVHMQNDDDDDDGNNDDEKKIPKKTNKPKSDMFTRMTDACQKNLDTDALFILSLLPTFKRIAERDKIKAQIEFLRVLNEF